MKRIELAGSRLVLPRLLGGVALAPEGAPPPSFDVGAAGVQRNVSVEDTTIAIGLYLSEKNATFACLFLDVPSARSLAQQLLEATA